MLKNDRLIKALFKEPVDKTPIWIMRQAGRYLPEYLETRKKARDFLSLCKNPELACEVTLQPLRRFDLDAAILFSDILTIPDALGLGLNFKDGEGPQFSRPIKTQADIRALGHIDPEVELRYVMDAVRLIRNELNNSVPLIGFAGSPWTVATYMIEGGSSKTFDKIKALLYSDPKTLIALLEKLTQVTSDYLNAQIHAGVQAVMLFDTWGGILTPQAYQDFSLYFMQRIISQLETRYEKQKIPTIIFTKSGGPYLEAIAKTGCDAVGIDWTIEIAEAKKRVGQRVAIQGNMEPFILFAEPHRIKTEVQRILEQFGVANGHVFNLGHGIHQHTPPDHVKMLVDYVHELSEPYHKLL